MKKYILAICISTLIISCKEDPPAIDFIPRSNILGDTTYMETAVVTPQEHNVLIEDMTGVKCANCVAGHELAKSSKDANPGRIVVMALHSYTNTQFTDPFDSARYDLRDSDANYIETQLLDNPGSLPAGGIDRKKFSSGLRWADDTKWSGMITTELGLSSPVNIEITNSYNASTREVTAVVKMTCTSNISDTLYLNVGLTESNIITKQLKPGGSIPNYQHNFVLRTMVKPWTGYMLNSGTVASGPVTLTQNRVIVKVFKFKVNPLWDENNCTVVGIVHKNGTLKDVVQVAEKKLL
jgi:hypothetical protein